MTHPAHRPAGSDEPSVPLVIAAHGTRDGEGEADAHELVASVAAALPGVAVHAGFIELSRPPLPDALEAAASALPAARGDVAVVPLMLGEAGHAKDDIPDAMAAAGAAHPHVRWRYSRVLGPHDGLVAALRDRVEAALDGAPAVGTTVVLVGRGSSDAHGNAGLAHTARLLLEAGGYDGVETSYVAVTGPTIGQALERARLLGARRVVVVPYVLFRGLMRSSVADQVAQWRAGRADTAYVTPHADLTHESADDVQAAAAAARAALDVRIAEVIGGCDHLVDVVVQRYREAVDAPARPEASAGGGDATRADTPDVVGAPDPDRPFPPYLSALCLQGRRALVVGGGAVARRKVGGLLAAGARVTVVAPEACDEVESWGRAGDVAWERRRFRPSDVNDAWYVVACADDHAVGAAVQDAATERGIFCVRADDADAGTAWTPAVGHRDGLSIAVLSNRDPRRSARVRDALLAGLDGGDHPR